MSTAFANSVGALVPDRLEDGFEWAVFLLINVVATLIVVGMVYLFSTSDARRSIGKYIVVAVATLALLVGGGLAYAEFGIPDESPRCDTTPPAKQLAPPQTTRWNLAREPREAKLKIALDDYVESKRTGTAFVQANPARSGRPSKGGERPILKPNAKVGAFVRGGSVSDKERGLGFKVLARGVRAPDGSGINVTACAWRPGERSLTTPGRYNGTVRVFAQGATAADLPISVTIKGSRLDAVILGLLVSLVGAALAGFGLRQPGAEEPPARESAAAKRAVARNAARAFDILPFLSGLAAGSIAAFVTYNDDPTWGAERGQDTVKFILFTFAAATGGLALTEPPARAVRKRLRGQR
jgi:hypothetical protein